MRKHTSLTMQPTTELTDALTPYHAQPRSRPVHVQMQQRPQQPVLPSHRSELELAVAEPPRPPATPPTPPITIHNPPTRSTNPHGGGVHAVQELLRFLTSTREAQEIEHKRRIAWEQEQEAKYKLRQAEMERRMLEMQQEITALKARVAFSNHPRSAPSTGSSVNVQNYPVVSQHSQVEYSPLVSQQQQQPTPSTSPTLSHTCTPTPGQPGAGPSTVTTPDMVEAPALASYLASPPLRPATRFVHVNPSSGLRYVENFVEGSDSEEDEDDSVAGEYRVRRKNHHDTRCLTIQHAMRHHILRLMLLDTDKELPDSHAEGTPLGQDDAIRFVWEKTPRQSVHNGRMKERILKDLKANRKLYRHVPEKDFGKKTLESAFDQAFVTLRQKFRAQRDTTAARAHKQREEVKAQRARRLSRRKVKLGNRSDARNRMGVFEHVTFDGALQMECMSSEESEEEEDAETGARRTIFRIRGHTWRSVRLQRFFDALDEDDRTDNGTRPRRGVGRRERYGGGPKEGLVIPPRGVSSWMVSKRWMREMAETDGGLLREVVVEVDPRGIDLGAESE